MSAKNAKLKAVSERDALSALVIAAAKGDREAFGAMIEATQKRLYRFALTLCGDPSQAEDLCQETYLKAHGHLASLSKPDAFIDWLFQITKNLYLDLCKSKAFKNVSLDDDENGVYDEPSADGHDMADIMAIRRAMSQFDPEDRCLLLLVDLEGRSYSEAAGILEISEDTVRTRLFRLRKLFLEKMSK